MQRPSDVTSRIAPGVRTFLAQEIEAAKGREVSFVATVDRDGGVTGARTVARGTVDRVLALGGVAGPGEMLLHNHPSGHLSPSGADLNDIDPDSHTPLVIALMNGHLDVAAALIRSGADVNAADNVGRTPLYAAVDLHTVPASNRPAPREADDNASSMEVVQMLLDKGANVNAALRAALPYRTKLDRGGDGVLGAGTTPLLRAAKAGDTPVIKMLLDKGANPKAATRNGVNAIMMAANVGTREEDMTGRNKTQKDAIETITLLVKAGTDVNGADTQGRTAAHGAAMWGHTDVIKFLAANGAKLDVKDKRGLTALDTANGLAGGFGFGGSASVVHDDTAKAIVELGGIKGTPIPAAPGGGRRGGDRNQDDPQDGDRN